MKYGRDRAADPIPSRRFRSRSGARRLPHGDPDVARPATSAWARTSRPRADLQAAVELSSTASVNPSRVTYETEPVGEVLDQPDLLNAVPQIETALILDRSTPAGVETEDPAQARHAPRPRPIDVDVLMLAQLEEPPTATFPHAELPQRVRPEPLSSSSR